MVMGRETKHAHLTCKHFRRIHWHLAAWVLAGPSSGRPPFYLLVHHTLPAVELMLLPSPNHTVSCCHAAPGESVPWPLFPWPMIIRGTESGMQRSMVKVWGLLEKSSSGIHMVASVTLHMMGGDLFSPACRASPTPWWSEGLRQPNPD